jgi:hypothetical protein
VIHKEAGGGIVTAFRWATQVRTTPEMMFRAVMRLSDEVEIDVAL